MQEEVALWKKVLTDAVASGEIGPQQDLDTVAATSTRDSGSFSVIPGQTGYLSS